MHKTELDSTFHIVEVVNVHKISNTHLLVDLITSEYGVLKHKRHYFNKKVWDEIEKRGWIE